MLTLYQTEWCPHSHRVRQRLTELGVDFVAKQVPARREDRADLRRATGTDRVPVLIVDAGPPLEGADAILGYLVERFEEPADARVHRAKAREHADVSRGARQLAVFPRTGS
jgi:glutathione S-transferase